MCTRAIVVQCTYPAACATQHALASRSAAGGGALDRVPPYLTPLTCNSPGDCLCNRQRHLAVCRGIHALPPPPSRCRAAAGARVQRNRLRGRDRGLWRAASRFSPPPDTARRLC
eukprot:scaffold100519_cov54-Phaeocystis_antarctica.AAC.1